MMNVYNNRLLCILIIMFAVVNIFLVLQINDYKSAQNKLEELFIQSQTKLYRYKSFLYENTQSYIYPGILTLEDIGNITSDSIYLIFIPSQACNACYVSLFADLKKKNINSDRFYLVMESPNKILQQDWRSFNFKNYMNNGTDISYQFPDRERIIIAKFIKGYKNFIYFNYKPEYSELLIDFL